MALEEVDIWRAAQQLLKLHGPDAELAAAKRADAALDQGDTEGFDVWKRITKATAELARHKPTGGETMN